MVDRFYKWAVEKSSIQFWKDDQNRVNDHPNDHRALGVQNSRVIVAFVSDAYFASKNCHKEINYAESLEKQIIFVKLQKNVKLLGRGAISLIANTKLYVSTFF